MMTIYTIIMTLIMTLQIVCLGLKIIVQVLNDMEIIISVLLIFMV